VASTVLIGGDLWAVGNPSTRGWQVWFLAQRKTGNRMQGSKPKQRDDTQAAVSVHES
jgi:hypothetical protein